MTQHTFHLKVTNEIELRLIEQQHTQELFDLIEANRKHLRQWLPWLDRIRSLADELAFVESSLRQFVENKGFHAGVWFKGRLCGTIGHHGFDLLNRSTLLGYWLDASHQGKGIMTASCRAVVNHAFTELGLHRVVIRCATENRRSRAIPEHLRFSLEGVSRQAEWLYDHFVDLAVYGLLRTDQ